jgi:hypothetical protein
MSKAAVESRLVVRKNEWTDALLRFASQVSVCECVCARALLTVCVLQSSVCLCGRRRSRLVSSAVVGVAAVL